MVVRARPLNIKEIKEDSRDVLFMDEINNECTILVPKSRKTMAAQGGNPNKSVTFSFDRCYNNKTTTAQMYNEIPYSLVQVRVSSFIDKRDSFVLKPTLQIIGDIAK